jgi:hypothetical protein
MVVAVTSLVSAVGWGQPRRDERFREREFHERHVVARLPMGARHMYIGGRPYWFHGGVYYMMDDDGSYVMVGAPVVSVLPRGYRVMVIGGSSYYVADDVYYRWTPDGYVVVERPADPPAVIVTTPPPAPVPAPAPETVTLYVPKKDADGFASVTLKKITGGFLGPQGEFYPILPRISLLTEMYGIPDILRQTPPDMYFIHVPNKDGQTYTRVELTRRNGGYVGPQGEFYPIMPTVGHLAEMYGASKEAPKVGAAAAPAPATPVKADDGTVHVQVTKKSGQGTVDVVLKKQDKGGYVGPQGEFYPDMPSTSQLTEVYGAQ